MDTAIRDINPFCKCGNVKEFNRNGKRRSPFLGECAECRRARVRENGARKRRVKNYERMIRELV